MMETTSFAFGALSQYMHVLILDYPDPLANFHCSFSLYFLSHLWYWQLPLSAVGFLQVEVFLPEFVAKIIMYVKLDRQ